MAAATTAFTPAIAAGTTLEAGDLPGPMLVPDPDTVLVAPVVQCITIADTCRTVAVDLHRLSVVGARGASITFALSPELLLCDPVPSVAISQGDWLSGFEPNIFFAAHDNGDGTFTVDQSILGQPCGATTGGTLFTVDIKKAPGFADSTGTLTVTSVTVSDCNSAPIPTVTGPPMSITIDTTAPPAITGIAVSKVTAGNDGDGTTQVIVSFDAPPPDVAAVEVWRAGYGNYPEYDDPPNGGAPPALPALYPPSLSDPRWVQTAVTASGQPDETTTRDFWYYIAISKDACGNPTLPGAMAPSLNYHLGDVTPAESPGDNQVNFFDISRLGTCYFLNLDPSDPCGDTDVAPVAGDGRPNTDNLVNFDDLLIFAINFEQVSLMPPMPAITATPGAAAPALDLEVEPVAGASGRFRASLWLSGNAGVVKGVHALVALPAGELTGVERGALLEGQGNEVFFAHDGEQQIVVDTAVLGRDVALVGNGEVAVLLFSSSSRVEPRLLEVDLRDAAGRPLAASATTGVAASGLGGAAAPAPDVTRYELLGARPNPFNPSTEIRFRLPQATPVSVQIYDIGGRMVRLLAGTVFPAGEHSVSWDGRDAGGRLLSSGVYFYAIQAGEIDAVEKLLMIK